MVVVEAAPEVRHLARVDLEVADLEDHLLLEMELQEVKILVVVVEDQILIKVLVLLVVPVSSSSLTHHNK